MIDQQLSMTTDVTYWEVSMCQVVYCALASIVSHDCRWKHLRIFVVIIFIDQVKISILASLDSLTEGSNIASTLNSQHLTTTHDIFQEATYTTIEMILGTWNSEVYSPPSEYFPVKSAEEDCVHGSTPPKHSRIVSYSIFQFGDVNILIKTFRNYHKYAKLFHFLCQKGRIFFSFYLRQSLTM